MENKFEFAKQIIREAGDLIKSSMLSNLQVEEKTRFDDLVTNVDKSTQELLVTKIKKYYPNDNIFAEENGLRHSISDGNVWVLDPIDGTVNFVAQRTHFAVMIGYYENGVGQFGLIYDVMNDLLYVMHLYNMADNLIVFYSYYFSFFILVTINFFLTII